MTYALAGERVIREDLQDDWTGGEAQVLGSLWAAIYQACCHVLPLEGTGTEAIRCATAIGGAPAVVEVHLRLSIGLSLLYIRCPSQCETDARQVAKEIARTARRLNGDADVLVPAQAEDDDLPF